MQGAKNLELSNDATRAWKEGEGEPEVWVEDLKSSNGTFVGLILQYSCLLLKC